MQNPPFLRPQNTKLGYLQHQGKRMKFFAGFKGGASPF